MTAYKLIPSHAWVVPPFHSSLNLPLTDFFFPPSMPKTPQRHGRTRASSGLAQGGTPNPADALNSGRTPPQIIHTYARKKLPRRRASSLLSIFSNFSDSLPPVEEVFSAIGKPLPPSAIDKINYHFRRLSKLASADTGQKFSDETAAFRQTLDTVRRYVFFLFRSLNH